MLQSYYSAVLLMSSDCSITSSELPNKDICWDFARESWTIKEAECRRIDAFELWCWRRLLRIPWTARRSNQSILKEISPGCLLEGLMLKLKHQYFVWPPDVKSWLFWKDPDAGEDWRWEEKGMTKDEMVGRHHRLNGHEFG